MSPRKWVPVVTVASVVAIALSTAACSSSGHSNSSSGAKGTITIGFIGSLQSPTFSFPETAAAAQARVDAVNAAGGINGHHVKLSVCNDRNDPNQAQVCVRQMVNDHAVGVVGGITPQGNTIISGLQSANLIYTGERALSPGELNSPVSFPVEGGLITATAGLGVYAATKLGCEKPFQIVNDDSSNHLGAAGFVAGYKYASHGGSVGQTVTPVPNTDYSAAVASASSARADCVMFDLDAAEQVKAIPLVRKQLPHAKLLDTSGSVPAPTLKALGQNATGMYLDDSVLPITTTGNSALDQIKAEMTKYEPKTGVDGFVVTSWIGTKLLLDTISKLKGDISAKSVLDAFNNLSTFNGMGLIGNFSFKSTSPLASAKRLFNRNYIVSKVASDGTLQPLGGFADATHALNDCTACGG